MDDYVKNIRKNLSIDTIKDKDGNTYGIRVLGRGENLFFQENDKALICQIDAVHGIIYTKSIRNWEGEKKMPQKERNRVINLIEKYYKQVYNPNVVLSD